MPDRGVIVAAGLAGLALPVLILAGQGAPAAGLAWPIVLAVAAMLAVVCPGWLLIDAFLPRRGGTDVLERCALVLGAGFAHLILGGLLLHDLPGPITVNRLAALHGVAALVYGIAAWRRGAHGRPRPVSGRTWAQIALVLVIAAGLRLPQVGWSEFQGDEAIVLTKAAAAVEGRDDAHYIHKKGPAEILITAQVYALQGRIDETRARLPFALATLAGLLSLFVVARGLFGGVAATVATLALGLNGFFIAFARIVQYQGVVFLMSTLALWCFLRLRGARDEGVGASVRAAGPAGASRAGADEPGPALDERDAPAWILLAALLLAAGLLAHYDAGLVAPALLWLLVRRWRSTSGAWRRDLPWIGAATVLGTLLLGAFYVPLARHPYFQTTTLPYLIEVRLGGGDEARGMFHNTLRNSATLATFYTAALVMLAWCAALGAEVVRRLRFWLPTGAGWAASALFLLGSAAILVRPVWFQWGSLNGTILFVAAVALAGLLARGPGEGWKAVWLWLVVPFMFYATVVESPRTHFHTAFPAWSILLALPLAAAWQWGGGGLAAEVDVRARMGALRSWARPILLLAGVGLYGYGARYAHHAFLDRAVEYKRGWPQTRLAGSWIPYPDLPSSGWFGFPYRAGWKTVGALYDGGALVGDYDSNEEQPVTGWYTRGRTRCDVLPRYVFEAEKVQDVRPIPEDLSAAGYVPVGEVVTMGRPRIAIWERADARSAGSGVGVGAAGANGAADAELGASSAAGAPLRYVDPATAIDNRGSDGVVNTLGGVGAGGAVDSSVAGNPFGALVDGFAATFDRRASGPAFERHLPYGDSLAYAPNPIDIDLGGQVRLRGWQIEGADSATAGGYVMLSLWWQATAPMKTDYSVFAHIEREGEITVGQHDGSPGARDAKGVCGAPRPTTAWQPGEVVVDRRVIQIARDAPPGDYPLLVGLYDYETLERLEILDEMGNPAGNRVELTTVRVGSVVDGASIELEDDGAGSEGP
jgi:4-amino-4-deoxy-L-arabinose transferase-like glycosyltransferase